MCPCSDLELFVSVVVDVISNDLWAQLQCSRTVFYTVIFLPTTELWVKLSEQTLISR